MKVYFYFCLVDDTLDDILGESGDEEEQDAIVNQVLDEIGIEISGKVRQCSVLWVVNKFSNRHFKTGYFNFILWSFIFTLYPSPHPSQNERMNILFACLCIHLFMYQHDVITSYIQVISEAIKH